MKQKRTPWQIIRKLLNDIHLWLGLASGLILFVVCFTGTVYTFHEEIGQWIDADKYYLNAPAGKSPLLVEELSQKLSATVEGKPIAVTIPANSDEAYQFTVRKEGERRGATYLVNPYTGALLGDTKSSASEFFMVMFRLHRWLMLDTSVGRPIVGWATIVFVVIILTGLVIWFPKKVKNWKQGLKVKWRANWKRINHDLHNALGLYTAVFLLIMALTGLQWSFSWYRSGLRSLLGVSDSRTEQQVDLPPVPSDSKALSVADLIRIAEAELPFVGAYRVELNSEAVVADIRKYPSGFFATPASDVLSINRYSGEVVSRELFADKPLNEKIARSIKALHVGSVFGTFSKIVYFISCLIATSLPVTGTLIWFNKLKKKKVNRSKVLA